MAVVKWGMRLIIVMLSLIASCTPAIAADPWDTTDKALGAAALTVWAVDWGQTRYIAKHPREFHEYNILLGEHPSVTRVNNYFIGVGIAGYLLADYLPSGSRKTFLSVFSAFEIGITAHNLHIGVKVAF